MTRFSSIETRWFFEGPLLDTAEVVDWYRHAPGRPVELPPPEWPDHERIDTYLVLARYGELGIKMRGAAEERPGSLEFKGCTGVVGETMDFGPPSSGRVDRWVKWSIPPSSVPAGLRSPFTDSQGDSTVVVGKRRLMRLLATDESDIEHEVAPSLRIARGLAFELTRIQAGGEHAWTLGFEAFRGEDWHAARFRDAVSRLLAGYPGPPLTEDRSMAYPTWLQRFADQP